MLEIFIKLLNMSIVASYLVLAIILIRFLFKKLPKAFVCVLWALVAVRLIFPISFESKYSMVPSAQVIPEDVMVSEVPYINTGMSVVNDYVNPVLSEMDEYVENSQNKVTNNEAEVIQSVGKVEVENSNISSNEDKKDTVSEEDNSKTQNTNILAKIMSVASYVWVFGIVAMLIYATISYFNIHRRINEAVPFEDNIWLCDRLKSPFILGIIKPRIVLPSFMNEKEMEYVLAHENAHLKRRDHLWKPLGFLLLTIYWFNPIMWVAYIFLCKDIEMACDEKVIKEKDATYKRAYTTTLLEYSISGRMITACPLAFGESGVKSRIKSVLNYKKPAFWVIIVSIIVCTGVVVFFLTNPKTKSGMTEDEKFEAFIRSCIWKNYDTDRYGEYHYGVEEHKILEKVENGDEISVYLMVLNAEYGHYRGTISEVEVVCEPTNIVIKKDKDGYMGYSMVEYWTPGEDVENEVRARFPEGIVEEALDNDLYKEEMLATCYESVDLHFPDEAWSEDKSTFTTKEGYVLTVEEFEKLNCYLKENEIYTYRKEHIDSYLKKDAFSRKDRLDTYFIKYGIEFIEDVDYSLFNFYINKGSDIHMVLARFKLKSEQYDDFAKLVSASLDEVDYDECMEALSIKEESSQLGDITGFDIYGVTEYAKKSLSLTTEEYVTGPSMRFIMLDDNAKVVCVYYYNGALDAFRGVNDSDKENTYGEYYVYPDVSGMNGDSIIAKCRIQESILDSMSTEQLVQAVVDFPGLDEYYYTSADTGSEFFKGICDAYAELVTRNDSKDVIIAKLKSLEESPDDQIKIMVVKDIVYNDARYKYNFTIEDIEYLTGNEQTTVGYYKYPTGYGEMDYNEYIASARIEQAVLDRMTSEQLAQAVFDFPPNSIYILMSRTMTVDDVYKLKADCDAYSELLTRADAKDTLVQKVINNKNSASAYALARFIVLEPQFDGLLSETEKKILLGM